MAGSIAFRIECIPRVPLWIKYLAPVTPKSAAVWLPAGPDPSPPPPGRSGCLLTSEKKPAFKMEERNPLHQVPQHKQQNGRALIDRPDLSAGNGGIRGLGEGGRGKILLVEGGQSLFVLFVFDKFRENTSPHPQLEKNAAPQIKEKRFKQEGFDSIPFQQNRFGPNSKRICQPGDILRGGMDS